MFQHELKNAYIGEGIWKPDSSRTLLYLKFNNNLTDSSGNGVTVTSGSSVSYGTVGDYSYIQNTGTGTSCVISSSANLISQIGSGDYTISVYQYIPTFSNNAPIIFGEWYDGSSPRPGPQICIESNKKIRVQTKNNTGATTANACTTNAWHHILFTRRSNMGYLYIDGQLDITAFSTTENYSSGSSHVLYMMGRQGYSAQTWSVTGAKMSEMIYEKIGWTDQEIQNYYNNTKGNYGL